MPEPPCPMQIFFSGARKEEFSLPFLVFRLIFAFRLLRSEDRFPLPKEEMFCNKFFCFIFVTVYISEAKLKNKYYVKKNFYVKISMVFLTLLLNLAIGETIYFL